MPEARTNIAEIYEEPSDYVELVLLPNQEYNIGLDDPEAIDEADVAEDEATDVFSVTEEETQPTVVSLRLKNYSTNLTSEEAALTRLADHDLLTPREVIDLAKRIERGDLQAKERLIKNNMRLVINIARRYRSPSLPFSDLVQEGSLGLIRAAEKFDYRKGFKFSTYATWWVRQSIMRGIQNTGNTIRVPVHVLQDMNKVRKAEEEIRLLTGREPTMEEIHKATGVSKERVMEAQIATAIVSLDRPLTEEGDETLIDIIPDKRLSVAEEVVKNAEEALVRQAVESLPDSPKVPIRQAVAARHELDDYPDIKEFRKEFHLKQGKIDFLARKGENSLRRTFESKGIGPTTITD